MPSENLGMPPDVEANGGDWTGKLILALQKWALAELSPDLQSKLNALIENNTDPRAAIAKDDDGLEGLTGKERDIALATQAAEILRRNNIDEGMIAKFIKKDFGVDSTSLAMDSARRERDEKSYRKMFPNAPTSFGEPTAAPRRREPHPRDAKSYFEMFPEARRLG